MLKLTSETEFGNELISELKSANKHVQSFNLFLTNLTFLHKKIVKERVESLNSKMQLVRTQTRTKLGQFLTLLRIGINDLQAKQAEYFKAAEFYETLKKENLNTKWEKSKQLVKIEKLKKLQIENKYNNEYVS